MATRGGARPGAGRKPGKVSQAKRDIAEQAKDHASKALAVLVEIAQDKEAPAAARVSAANAIIDRGYGKPTQAVEVDGALNVAMPTVIEFVAPNVDDEGED